MNKIIQQIGLKVQFLCYLFIDFAQSFNKIPRPIFEHTYFLNVLFNIVKSIGRQVHKHIIISMGINKEID